MNDGSTSLHKLCFHEIKIETLEEFLALLEISYKNGRVTSNRNIEVFVMYFRQHYSYFFQLYKDCSDLCRYVNFFDGLSHILLKFHVFNRQNHGQLRRRSYSLQKIEIELYKNQEALNIVKNVPPKEGFKRIRVNVYPE